MICGENRDMRSDHFRSRAWNALRTLRALRTGVALGSLRARNALRALRTDVALLTLETLRALKALRTGIALWALRTDVALLTLETLRTDGTQWAHRAQGHIE